MPHSPRRFQIFLLVGVIAALSACADDATPATEATADSLPATTAAADTTSAPTTAPSTTSAPTTSVAPSTTAAEEVPDFAEVTVVEDLERPFPVSAGWIVESTDQSVTVGLTVGPESCYGLASAEAEETENEVRITMAAGFLPDASGCGDPAPAWTYTFDLESPLGDRVVVDAHTGQELGTEPPDPDA